MIGMVSVCECVDVCKSLHVQWKIDFLIKRVNQLEHLLHTYFCTIVQRNRKAIFTKIRSIFIFPFRQRIHRRN